MGVIATQATVRSHAYFEAIKDENPFIEVYEHATPALVPLVEAGQLDGPEVEASCVDPSRRCWGPRRRRRGGRRVVVFPLPRGERIDTLLLGCTHYPLLVDVIRGRWGRASRSSTPRRPRRPRWRACWRSTPTVRRRPRTHVQLTTGDVAAFRRTADLLFGGFGDVPIRRLTAGAAPRAAALTGAPALIGHAGVTIAGIADRLRTSRAVAFGWRSASACARAVASRAMLRPVADRALLRPADGLVDWDRAQRIAQRRLGAPPGASPASSCAPRGRPTPAPWRASCRCWSHAWEPTAGGRGASRRRRPRRLGARQPGHLPGARGSPRAEPAASGPQGSLRAAMAVSANRFLTTRQVGFLLGYLGTRVLGQYDIALLSAEEAPGRLLFVEENIRSTARSWASRWTTSGPGSRSTRRPTRSSWRRIRGCGPTSGSAWSARSRCS